MKLRNVGQLPVLDQTAYPPIPIGLPPEFIHGGWKYEQDGYGALGIFAACVQTGVWMPISFWDAAEVAKKLYPNQGVSALIGIANLINEGLVEGLELSRVGYAVPKPEMVKKVLAQYRGFYGV